MSAAYVAIAVAALAVVFAVVWFRGPTNRSKRLTPLAGLAFGFVIAGIVFGDNRLIAYSLMGVGVTLAIVDNILVRRRP